MKGGIQQQLASNTMKLENMLTNELTATDQGVKGLREEMELKTNSLPEKLTEEVKQPREELEQVQVANAKVASTTATIAQMHKSEEMLRTLLRKPGESL